MRQTLKTFKATLKDGSKVRCQGIFITGRGDETFLIAKDAPLRAIWRRHKVRYYAVLIESLSFEPDASWSPLAVELKDIERGADFELIMATLNAFDRGEFDG